MTVHGFVLAIAAAIATMYLGWMVADRNGDGPLLGWVLGALVLVGGFLWAMGF